MGRQKPTIQGLVYGAHGQSQGESNKPCCVVRGSGKEDGGEEEWVLELTSMGVDRVTLGVLRLRALRTWGRGSWRWPAEVEGEAPAGPPCPEAEAEEEAAEGEGGEEAEAEAEAAPAAEVLAPSSVS